jgi:hypothetical protein
MNRLDNLPNDILYQILEFCADHIQFDFKKNVINSSEFQNRLKMQYLAVEYDEIDDEDEQSKKERNLTKYLFRKHPVNSFDLTYNPFQKSFEVEYAYKTPNRLNEVSYNKIQKFETLYVESFFELRDAVLEELQEHGLILQIEPRLIYENLFTYLKEEWSLQDVVELVKNYRAQKLKGICRLTHLADEVIRIQGFEQLLNLAACEQFGSFYIIKKDFEIDVDDDSDDE